MTRAVRLLALLLGLAAPLTASAQMSGVDMTLPKMTEASLTRDEVVALLDAATKNAPADLSGLWLNGLDLSGLDFTGVNFRATALNGTNLSGAILDRAALSQSWMIGADLTGASLIEAELFQTQLREANLTGANLTRARTAADFSRANLTGTIFREADFSADMRNQSMGLMRGVLTSARGEGADFTGASMSRADLEFAKLPGAIFSG
ncbi:MAG TPA: pentapeptide repeat-containing protein, partial [Kiloniellaceae bacterium]|nr:pentapeptide repeat-containing protein [Kiloniellaceae bacterium]